MKKTTVLSIILSLLFPAIFNTCFFLIGGTEHTASVWIAYGFIHLAFLLLLATPLLTRKGKSAVIFGLSISIISTIYFAVEFVIGVIFILVSAKNYKASLIVQLIVFVAYAAFLLTHLIANEHTADAEEKRQGQIDFIKSAANEIKSAMALVADKQANTKLQQVYDTLITSPVKSSPAVIQIESAILMGISDIREKITLHDDAHIDLCAQQILSLVNERNQKLKLYN